MRQLINILFILALGMLSSQYAGGQSLSSVCTGSIEEYAVNGIEGSVFIWEVDNELINVENFGDTAEIDWNVPGVHRITVREISQYGCEGAPVYAFVEVTGIKVDLGDDVTICQGQTVTFSPGAYDSYRWQDGYVGDSYSASSQGKIWVEVTSQNCKGSDTVNIEVVQGPAIDLGPDVTICGDNFIELDAGNYLSYNWQDGSIGRYYTANAGPRQIWVEVTDENNCQASDTLNVLACSAIDAMGEITNVFTPNGDGNHDTWEINNIDFFPNASVEIFDRWGRLVYSSQNGYNNDWDGRDLNGNILPMDSYLYVIDINVDEIAPVSGTVTIVR